MDIILLCIFIPMNMSTPSCLVVIPARLTSSRLSRKLTRRIGEHTILQHVYLRLQELSDRLDIVVATDDEILDEHARQVGAQTVMTRTDHINGTSRCAEVATKYDQYDYIINVQGDEPFISPDTLLSVVDSLSEGYDIVSVYTGLHPEDHDVESVVKVHVDSLGMATRFERMVDMGDDYHQHMGIYAFKKDLLPALVNLPPSQNEKLLNLEQLRWLDHGYQIHMVYTPHHSRSIDTLEDLIAARADQAKLQHATVDRGIG